MNGLETIEEKLKRLEAMDAQRANPVAAPMAAQAPAPVMQPMAPQAMPVQPMAPQPMQPMAPGPVAPMTYPWQGQQQQPMYPPAPLPQATGIAVQVSVKTPQGDATAFLMYGPEWAASSQAAQQLVAMLLNAGFSVKTWQKKGGGW